MHNPIIFLFGYKTIRADMSCAAKILNLCGDYGIPYISQRTDSESFYIECSLPSAIRLLRLCEKNGIELLSVTPHGLPHLLYTYRRRCGLFLGAIIAVVLIFLSGRFLWDIRIDGERKLTEKEVLDELYA